MRIKLDENLPIELVAELRALGHAVDDVSEGLSGRPDEEIFDAVHAEQRILITQDVRFARMFMAGPHAGFVLIRVKGAGRRILIARVRNLFEREDVESWSGCFVVLSDAKIRVRRPRRDL
jgi:predicted nuclease of predicted toxin-antitoxin system